MLTRTTFPDDNTFRTDPDVLMDALIKSIAANPNEMPSPCNAAQIEAFKNYKESVKRKAGFSKATITMSEDFNEPMELVESKKLTELQEYLLSWPVMTDEEFNYIQEKRKHFNGGK